MNALWRIIDTGAMEPFANMAFDEAILRGYRSYSSPPTLRVYGWDRPSLSLGYSQDSERELDTDLCRKMSIPFVRRITGGGIILHGNELTYSIVCSKEDLGIPSRVASSYRVICQFLISFYNALGIKAGYACDVTSGEALGRPSALCFAAKEKYDIVTCGRKIGGSAQKRSGDVIFQHGSIPFNFDNGRASSYLKIKTGSAGEDRATCLEEILGEEVGAAEMSDLLIGSFTDSFDVKTVHGGMSDAEATVFTGLKSLKYGSMDWNLRRIDRSGFNYEEGDRCIPSGRIG